MGWDRRNALVVALAPAPAQQGTTPCAIHDDMAERLKTGYDEQPAALGLSSNGRLLEIFTSPSGSWSILLTRPDGISCLMAVGESWQEMVREIVEVES